MDPDIENLVIDCGSGYTKCGFSGDHSPRAIFPSVVGRIRHHGIMMWDRPDCFVGDEAQAKRGILRLKYPIEHGLVTNWNDMEKIWHHTFYNELRVSPEEHTVLLTESPIAPKNSREKMTSIMFETFNVFGLCSANSSVLSLYSAGRTSGMSVEIGDSVTSICPVYEGHMISRASKQMNLGGREVTDSLVKILNSERGYELTTSAEREVVRDIKEKLCFTSLNYEEELLSSQDSIMSEEEEYELPDGSKLTLGSELFRAPELFFKPSLIGSDLDGIPDRIVKSLLTSGELPDDEYLRGIMVDNICVSGGSSRFPGIMNRIRKDFDQKYQEKCSDSAINNNNNMFCSVYCPEFREYSAWLGGSIFSSLSWFVKNKYILKDEYDDCGATIIHRKCL